MKSATFSEQRIGLFFGSFNPVHIGHLIIANIMVEHTNLDKVWFVLSPHNPFKKSGSLLHEFDRYDMLKAAIADQWNLEVSDIEFNLPKPNYTIDTLTYLKEKHPNKTFCLIIGEDNLNSFSQWKNHEEIINHYPLYVYPRFQSHNQQSNFLSHSNVLLVDAPLLNISASFIRQCIKKNLSIRYLVPDSVVQLIEKKLFYA